MKKCRIFVVIPTTRLTGRKSEIPRTVAALGIQVVDDTGLEPVQYCYREILSLLCLPIPPHRQLVGNA